jgi:hypothetical protein
VSLIPFLAKTGKACYPQPVRLVGGGPGQLDSSTGLPLLNLFFFCRAYALYHTVQLLIQKAKLALVFVIAVDVYD